MFAKSIQASSGIPTVGLIGLEAIMSEGRGGSTPTPLYFQMLQLTPAMSVNYGATVPVTVRMLPGLSPLPG